jgi:uncharacterized protein
MVAVRVAGVLMDQRFNSPVVLLQENDGERVLPIFVGPAEATAIAIALEKQEFPRPMTLDLMKLMLDAMGAKVSRVIVSALKDDTFFASLVVERDAQVYSFDARPSDSIGLAVRFGAPILVADEVMAAAAQVPALDEESRLKEMQERLRSVSPEDIGNVSI